MADDGSGGLMGMLSGLFGQSGSGATPTMTSVGNYQMPTFGSAAPAQKNDIDPLQIYQAFAPKAPQVSPLQINMAQAPQRQMPQLNFGSLAPFSPPPNPMMTGR